MLKETLNIMIGQREDKEVTDKIKEKVCSYKEVQGAYDLSLHNYGPSKTIATVHIQVRDDMTAKEIHALTKQMTIDIYNELGIITTIGIYAANDNGEYVEIKKELSSIVKEYKDVKQLHGFYVNEKERKIYFDLIFDFACKDREKIKDEIIQTLKEKYPKYEFVVIIDDDISD
jgi:divalent metal cation (Fe/Co/Zn/Cd) transporter